MVRLLRAIDKGVDEVCDGDENALQEIKNRKSNTEEVQARRKPTPRQWLPPHLTALTTPSFSFPPALKTLIVLLLYYRLLVLPHF